ncbi:LysR family transcriptional regulator [Mesorhizobium sp. ZC-5]|uniref:LysR family transcriptional regulator n=1 Tax=Mesorhizobium sp. ZC-5 TaxID=2986066 RepID=UPI0021E8F353|nr:LysR family transcriptional regulator [Mesorhizobium sp. ZC-5]MCV3239284.1 LysR family transcriptional regulator [Mesorhizobium sp. ZC-5]
MDTRFLETFLAVAEQGSLMAAARRLNISPAAVAQRIRALEGEFGVKLLTRSGREVAPTEAGLAVIQKGRDLLREARDLVSIAGSGSMSGELRIGSVSSALTGILPDVMRHLFATHPSIDLFIKPGSSKDLYAEVVAGNLDACAIVEPRLALPKTHVFRSLRDEPLVLIAPSALAGGDAVTLLENEPFIRYDRSHWGGHIADEYLKQMRIRPRDRLEVDSLEAIAVMVSRGIGVSLVPDWAPPWPAGLDIAKFELPPPAQGRRIGLFYVRMSPRQKLIDAFVSAAFPSG